MKAALLYGLQDLRLVDIPVPALAPKSILIKVNACGICSSDIRKYHTIYGGRLKLPDNMGHEYVGTVIAIGKDADNFEIGMRVVGDGFGGYAEYALVDLTLEPSIHDQFPLIVPDLINDNAAIFIEPLACCIHTVKERAKISADQTCLIIGGGTMGQLNLLVAKSEGARVILSEPYELRREMALSLGADVVVDPQVANLPELIRRVNNNHLVDATILTIGNPASVQEAIKTVRPGGKVILFGRFPPGAKVKVDPHYLYRTEIDLLGSYWVGGDPKSANIHNYQEALTLMQDNKVPVEKLVSKTYPLARIQEAFTSAMRMDTYKIVLLP